MSESDCRFFFLSSLMYLWIYSNWIRCHTWICWVKNVYKKLSFLQLLLFCFGTIKAMEIIFFKAFTAYKCTLYSSYSFFSLLSLVDVFVDGKKNYVYSIFLWQKRYTDNLKKSKILFIFSKLNAKYIHHFRSSNNFLII